MPAEDSKLEAAKSPLVQLFRRKLQAALQLTQDDVGREAKSIHDLAFSVRLTKARNAEGPEKSHVLQIPNAEDPERSKSITGDTQRERLDGALSYYRGALLARLKPIVRENFKPVAQVAAQLIAAGFAREVDEVHQTTFWVIHNHKHNLGWIQNLHEWHGRPDLTASFVLEFADMFTDLWCRLVLKAELEATSLPPTQASESAGAVVEDESAAARRRRTQQIGDRVVSHRAPVEGEGAISEETAWQVELGRNIHFWYTELQRVQNLYPGGTTESAVRKDHPEFGFLGEIVGKLGETDRADLFARLHMLGAPEIYDFIGRALRRSGNTVLGYAKAYRNSVKTLTN